MKGPIQKMALRIVQLAAHNKEKHIYYLFVLSAVREQKYSSNPQPPLEVISLHQ